MIGRGFGIVGLYKGVHGPHANCGRLRGRTVVEQLLPSPDIHLVAVVRDASHGFAIVGLHEGVHGLLANHGRLRGRKVVKQPVSITYYTPSSCCQE